MKHLKKYNESVNEKTIEDVRDICQELEDESFDVKFYPQDERHYGYTQPSVYIINITKTTFLYNDVKEVLLRLRDYLCEDGPRGLYDNLDVNVYPQSFSYLRYTNCEFDENDLRGRCAEIVPFTDNKIEYILYRITNMPLLCIKIKFDLNK